MHCSHALQPAGKNTAYSVANCNSTVHAPLQPILLIVFFLVNRAPGSGASSQKSYSSAVLASKITNFYN